MKAIQQSQQPQTRRSSVGVGRRGQGAVHQISPSKSVASHARST